MADFDKEFFEGVKDGVTKGKIECSISKTQLRDSATM